MVSGSGIPGVEDLNNFHGKALGEKGIAEISARIKNKVNYWIKEASFIRIGNNQEYINLIQGRENTA